MGQKRIFVARHYDKSRRKSGITDQQLCDIAADIIDHPDKEGLGGGVYKKRVSTGLGKRGGARTIVAYHREGNVFSLKDGRKTQYQRVGRKFPMMYWRLLKLHHRYLKTNQMPILKRTLKTKSLLR
ncbi:type II toxin-antitoxin system RelE/ParE family toxin [Pectobacterium peruviense]|uniref:type II toxin-antitoxin system RelE/ParE family toxin n=1 Tax=Pectobacterium peruviense TaxID=2066479 RepID=UPI000DE49D40|nr:type II toxin-antitoxin system RelE/ParE family toxin [Pectobacterium peruviense]